MRMTIAAVAAVLFASAPAHADQTEGKIRSVDAEKLTIVLDDGQTYKLPGEMDMTAIEEGIEIVIAFDEVNGVKMITDMEVLE